ncbi:MAG: phosphatidylglycerol lysyltransferase domain-containing protein [Oscillospiraceae bacterium]
MLNFKAPTIADKAWTSEIMRKSGDMACEYCFGNLYMWSTIYENTIANYNGMFLARDGGKNPSFLYPCGDGDKLGAINELIEFSKSQGEKLLMYCLTPSKVRELEKLMPEKFYFEEMRDYFDYIYSSSDLSKLEGRKYHSKRNHITFLKNNFDWKYETISHENIYECFKMNEKWANQNRYKNPEEIDNEQIAIKSAFEKYFELDFKGGLLKVDGEVVAFTMGEEISKKVFCTHIEKAFGDVRGAYPAINQEFAKNELSSYEYINREEDTGSEGLRRAKLSYNPAILLPKYKAVFKN